MTFIHIDLFVCFGEHLEKNDNLVDKDSNLFRMTLSPLIH